MSANAIVNVTKALRGRLETARAKSSVPGSVFVGPLNDDGAGGAALILFLYRIVPNASLRNHEHRVATNGPPPGVKVHRNSLPLDLYYLVTVGTDAGDNEEKYLQALGFAMQELQGDPELTGAALDHQTVHIALEPLTTDEASRIWALFPTANYRTSVAYLATPVWIDPPDAPPEAALVTEDRLLAGSKIEEVRA